MEYNRRLESFSDIVLAFSLGQLAINSVIPAHAIDILTHPITLVAYALTFGIVVSIWTMHHRLFAEYFKATPLSTTLNFLTLGFVVFFSYTVQLYVHFRHATAAGDDATAAAIYFTTFGIVLLLMGVLYALGTHDRREELTGPARTIGTRRATRLACMGVALLVGVPLTRLAGASVESAACILLVAGSLGGRMAGRAIAKG